MQQIYALLKQLFPTGRAFKGPPDGWLDSLRKAISISVNRLAGDSVAILNSILPDNANFTIDDATDWERRLGLVYSPLMPLQQRMDAIKRKMNHPGTILPRQNFKYIQQQLQDAGFNVYVYENLFYVDSQWTTKNPVQVGGLGGLKPLEHGQKQHGNAQHGGVWNNIIANYIDENIDQNFNVGSNLFSTFFIGGTDISNPMTAYAQVPANQKNQFRDLILKLKPAHCVGYLFIVYT